MLRLYGRLRRFYRTVGSVLEKYIYSGGRRLRCGYTTGSCAAGAAKAAAEMLLTGKIIGAVDIVTPKGIMLRLGITDAVTDGTHVSCAVVKDSGDDPDVTNGIKVYADVRLTDSGIEITGGSGVGTVTKPGLDQPVGASAINSVPREMIKRAVAETAELYEYSGGFSIVISVPGGEELASKTFNPRMGITGGISIIGTTGIVEPMSDHAIVETIRTEANMRRAEGHRTLLLTVGNYSEKYISEMFPELAERCVMCSNFIGEALDTGAALGFERVLLCGHIGKLVKLGSGIMNTHSSCADGRIETLIACAALAGADGEVFVRLTECITADSAVDVLYEYGIAGKVLEKLTERIEYYLAARVKSQIQTAALVFSYKNGLLLKTSLADDILRAAMEE